MSDFGSRAVHRDRRKWDTTHIGQICIELMQTFQSRSESVGNLSLRPLLYADLTASFSTSSFMALWQASRLDAMLQLKRILTFFG